MTSTFKIIIATRSSAMHGPSFATKSSKLLLPASSTAPLKQAMRSLKSKRMSMAKLIAWLFKCTLTNFFYYVFALTLPSKTSRWFITPLLTWILISALRPKPTTQATLTTFLRKLCIKLVLYKNSFSLTGKPRSKFAAYTTSLAAKLHKLLSPITLLSLALLKVSLQPHALQPQMPLLQPQQCHPPRPIALLLRQITTYARIWNQWACLGTPDSSSVVMENTGGLKAMVPN